VPTFWTQYTDVTEPDGVHVYSVNVDPDFSNCLDGLICVDLELADCNHGKTWGLGLLFTHK
jgi:hypothetical protein